MPQSCRYKTGLKNDMRTKTNYFPRRAIIVAFWLIVISAARAASQSPNTNDWAPITPAETAMKSPVVEPDADAEAIFWKMKIDDKRDTSVTFDHYVRIKIFTERGREKYAKLDIPFSKRSKIENLAARVIRPDGSVQQVGTSDIFTREIVKTNKITIKAYSLAMPGIDVGSIIEYRYSEKLQNAGADGSQIVFQREIPIQNFSCAIRPWKKRNFWTTPYNMETPIFNEQADGFHTATLTNVPALKEEPFMPPAAEVEKWLVFQYSPSAAPFTQTAIVWNLILTKFAKPSKKIKAKAEELTAGLTTKRERALALHKFVQTSIRRPNTDNSVTSETLREQDIDSLDEVLEKRMGSSIDTDLLFAALAKAAGLDVKVAIGGDKSENFFSRTKYPYANFISFISFAIAVDENRWEFVDPCAAAIPFGMLPWEREGVESLIVGSNGMTWSATTMNSDSQNNANRSGKFTLAADGTIEGEIRMLFTGQESITRKQSLLKKSQAEREEYVKESLKSRLTTAEISNITISGLEDSAQPLIYTLKLRIPNYASKTGKRLFIQPNVFEFGSSAVFSASTRRFPVFFPYPRSESDTISIKLPPELTIDAIDSPPAVRSADASVSDSVSIVFDKAENTIRYTRDFYFGRNRKLLFDSSQYASLKQMFDMFHKTDTHVIAATQK
ncbi:MAG: hypothetical protein C4325_03400 [Blastocatellia bacterium]